MYLEIGVLGNNTKERKTRTLEEHGTQLAKGYRKEGQ